MCKASPYSDVKCDYCHKILPYGHIRGGGYLNHVGLWIAFKAQPNIFNVRAVERFTWKKTAVISIEDISDYKRAKEALRESEDKYQLIIETVVQGIQEVDTSGQIIFTNSAYHRMLGYESGELIGRSMYETQPNDSEKKKLRDYVQILIQQQPKPEPYFTKTVKKNGDTLDVQTDWNYKRNSQGDVSGFISIITDITERKRAEDALHKAHHELEIRVDERTVELAKANEVLCVKIAERKQAEEALRESEARFRQLFDEMKDGLAVYEAIDGGKDFVFKDLNVAGESISNVKKSEIIGKSLYEIRPNIDEFGLVDVLRRVFQTGKTEHHSEKFYEDGELQGWFDNYVYKLESGEVVALFTDNTARRVAEEALRESNLLFSQLFEQSTTSMCLYKPDGTMLKVNDEFSKMFGVEEKVIIDSGYNVFRDQATIDAGVIPLLREIFDEKKSRTWKIDFDIGIASESTGTPTARPERIFIEVFGYPVVNREGNLEYVVLQHYDLTVQKRAEEEKAKLESQLQQSHKMEAIGTLTGGIAHDYNNLMSIIMGNLSIAMEDAEPGSVQADCLNEVNIASHKVRDLTHELMSLSRGGAPVKEVGSLKEPLQSASNVIPADGSISLKESGSQDLWQVSHDPYKMGAVFRNVVTNAVEAMPGGGTLEIKAENLCLARGDTDPNLLLKPGDYVHVSIQDQGKGIPKEYLDKIFDPYFSTKAMGTQKGMGLGLATSYAIVQKHGGHIAINSSSGAGTTVNIYLPAESHPEEIHGTTTSADDKASPVKRVLVMDDEEMLRKLARQMLERMGYAVETVKDGVEAIAAYKDQKDSGEPFDAAILDLTIKGGMGGEQAMRELLKIDPGIKAIVSSGYFNDPVMSDFEKYGFMGALPKPYEKKALKEVLERLSE